MVPKESLAYVTDSPARLSPSPQNQNSLPEEETGNPSGDSEESSWEDPSIVEEAPLSEGDVSQKSDDSFPEEGMPDAFSRHQTNRFQPKKKPSVSSTDKISKHHKNKDKDTE